MYIDKPLGHRIRWLFLSLLIQPSSPFRLLSKHKVDRSSVDGLVVDMAEQLTLKKELREQRRLSKASFAIVVVRSFIVQNIGVKFSRCQRWFVTIKMCYEAARANISIIECSIRWDYLPSTKQHMK